MLNFDQFFYSDSWDEVRNTSPREIVERIEHQMLTEALELDKEEIND